MKHNTIIPTTIQDNFFEDPDKIRQWAMYQPFYPSADGRWPGLRTDQIYAVDHSFFHLVIRKSLSLFFDLQQEENISWTAEMNFQIVHKNYDNCWVNSDVYGNQITGIVFLNKHTNLTGSTSILREKNNVLAPKDSLTEFKKESFLKKKTIQEVEAFREEHNSQFEEIINISNVYNRLVLFDSHLFHKSQSFSGQEDDGCLSLIFFIKKLLVNNTPISRSLRA